MTSETDRVRTSWRSWPQVWLCCNSLQCCSAEQSSKTC